MSRMNAILAGRRAAETLLDSIGRMTPDEQDHALSAVIAMVNNAKHDNNTALHVQAIGDGPCPAARCTAHKLVRN